MKKYTVLSIFKYLQVFAFSSCSTSPQKMIISSRDINYLLKKLQRSSNPDAKVEPM